MISGQKAISNGITPSAMMVDMKQFSLRNILLAVPCFAMAIGIYVQHQRFVAAIAEVDAKGALTVDGHAEVFRKSGVPAQVPSKASALVIAFLGFALLFGRWRVAAVIGTLVLVGTVMYFAGF
jgi:hypothetical protein